MFIHCSDNKRATPVNLAKYDKIKKLYLHDEEKYCIVFYKDGNSSLNVVWEFKDQVTRDHYYCKILECFSSDLCAQP